MINASGYTFSESLVAWLLFVSFVQFGSACFGCALHRRARFLPEIVGIDGCKVSPALKAIVFSDLLNAFDVEPLSDLRIVQCLVDVL